MTAKSRMPVTLAIDASKMPRRPAAWPWVAAALVGVFCLWGYVPPAQNVDNVGWDSWQPRVGYAWVEPRRPHRGVRWQPGFAHPQVAHVRADQAEGKWITEPGYVFTKPTELSPAAWQPGLPHRDIANVVAAATEGYWETRPGYRFATPGLLSPAVWTPGVGHPQYPNVVTVERPDQWQPAAGYQWLTAVPGDFRVMAIPTRDRAEQFVTGLIKFAFGAAIAKQQSDDGIIMRSVVRPFSSALYEDGLKDISEALKR